MYRHFKEAKIYIRVQLNENMNYFGVYHGNKYIFTPQYDIILYIHLDKEKIKE